MYTNSIFEESWWLDAVAPGNWKELKVEEDGQVVARWPIVFKGKEISNPKYTQTLGIYLNPEFIKTTEDEERVYLKLLEQLPANYSLQVALDPKNQFYLPFVWNNMNIHLGASYIIEDLHDVDAVFASFSKNIQRDIKQSQKKVQVVESNDVEKLISMSLATYRRQHREYVVRPDVIRRIYKAAMEHEACKLYAAVDGEGQIHSMTLFVYDEHRCYYLIGANEPELNAKSCANTLLIWQGIQLAAQKSQIFDFEGSTIKGIATFFSRFGSKFSYHFAISRQSLGGELYGILKPRIKKLLGHKK